MKRAKRTELWRRKDQASMHITPVGGNVFADLGFPPDEAARLLAESDAVIDASLNTAGRAWLDARDERRLSATNFTEAEAAEYLEIPIEQLRQMIEKGEVTPLSHRNKGTVFTGAMLKVIKRRISAANGAFEAPKKKLSLAALMLQMPGGPPILEDWDEMPAVGLEKEGWGDETEKGKEEE